MAGQQDGIKIDKDFAQKFLTGIGLLYGVYWAAIGISGAKGSWVHVVSDVFLIILVACGAFMGFLPKSDTSKKKK
jgi:hypothetical protein